MTVMIHTSKTDVYTSSELSGGITRGQRGGKRKERER